MQSATKEWLIRTISQLSELQAEQLKDYLEFLTWKSNQNQEPKTVQNPIAQRIIKVMENSPHLTYADGEALRQSIEEGKMPVKFDSPFKQGECEEQ